MSNTGKEWQVGGRCNHSTLNSNKRRSGFRNGFSNMSHEMINDEMIENNVGYRLSGGTAASLEDPATCGHLECRPACILTPMAPKADTTTSIQIASLPQTSTTTATN